MSKSFRVGPSTCWVSPERTPIGDTVLTLYGVQTEADHIGKGYGSALMKEVRDYAQSLKLPVRLYVEPYYHRALNTIELIRWYNKQGFRISDMYNSRHIWMEYNETV